MFYYLIDSATGEKLGETADKAKNAPRDMSGREWVEFRVRPSELWNPATRSHDEREKPKRYITKSSYLDLFEDDELKKIIAISKINADVELLLQKLTLINEVNLDSPKLKAGLETMEAGGILGTGRAAEITA